MEEVLIDRLPTSGETEIANEALSAISRALDEAGKLNFVVKHDGESSNIQLPRSMASFVVEMLTHIGRGEMVTLVPYASELSTQKAADLLNVSRPHLIKLLDSGEIEFYKAGTHRRVVASELLAYKTRRDQARKNAMRELQRLSQEFEAG